MEKVMEIISLLNDEDKKKILEMANMLLKSKTGKKTGKGTGYIPRHSSARSLLKYAGKWAGDDLEECLKEVYAIRGKIEV